MAGKGEGHRAERDAADNSYTLKLAYNEISF